jgi:hypothetical protein
VGVVSVAMRERIATLTDHQRWALRELCEHSQRRRTADWPLLASVNLDLRIAQLGARQIHANVLHALAAKGLVREHSRRGWWEYQIVEGVYDEVIGGVR